MEANRFAEAKLRKINWSPRAGQASESKGRAAEKEQWPQRGLGFQGALRA